MKIKNFIQEFVVSEDRSFDSCHASTVLPLSNGNVLCAFFGGAWEKSPDTAIWTAKRENGSWRHPKKAVDIRGIAMWNPVLFRKKDGRIRLFYKVGEDTNNWKTFFSDSFDEGDSFSQPIELVAGDTVGGRGPVKNKLLRLQNGDVLAPGSLEGSVWDAFADISHDDGDTWEISEFVPVRRVLLNHQGNANTQMIHRPYDEHLLFGKGMIQPSLWEDEDGVHMFCRTTSSRIFRSDSKDGGRTWGLAYDTGLPNNNSGLDLTQTQDGRIILVYNPRENFPGYYKGARTPLEVAVSFDHGKTFERLLTLEDAAGNFAYPAVVADDDNHVMITYTWNRERIRYCSFILE